MSYNSKVIDSSGNSRELRKIWGQQTGTILAPINTKAIEFDGNDDYIEIGDHDIFSFVNADPSLDNSFSITAWVNRTNIPDSQGVFVAKNSGNGVASDWFFGHNNGRIQVRIYDGTGSNNKNIGRDSGLGDLPLNEWHFVAFTYDGTQAATGIKVYLDGALLATSASSSTGYAGRINTTSPLRIGANAAGGVGNDFEKFISDVCICDKELSLSEVQELYNTTDSGRVKDMTTFSAFSSVISWWKMGDGDNSGANGIRDSVGAYHGTLEGNAKIVNVKNLKSDYKLITV